MATSNFISIQISDIVKWWRDKELIINDTFQRRSVWTSAAKTYLIDTILKQLPIPKIYLRTIIDPKKLSSIREIVDGQQRIRAIIEFANDNLRLSNRSEDYAGLVYSDLDEDNQNNFLGYIFGAEQLMNASDDDVLEVFSRLNSYTVILNYAEKRHAQFQTEFKWAVRDTASHYKWFLEKYDVFTLKQRFRMADDTFFAEVFGVILKGIAGGEANNIKRLYKEQEDDVFTESINHSIKEKIEEVITFLDNEINTALTGKFSKHYHLLMMIAAYIHHKHGIPQGKIGTMPERSSIALTQTILDRLAKLESALDAESPPSRIMPFVEASKASTHHIRTRRIRFCEMVRVFGA